VSDEFGRKRIVIVSDAPYPFGMMRAVSMVVAGVAVVAVTVAAVAPDPEPVTPAPDTNAAVGEFVWHDLVTDNPAASRVFYGALFGWTFAAGQGIDPGYTMIEHEGRPIGGIVPRRQENAAAAQWLAYVVVADVDHAARTFEQAGGRIFRGPLNARRDLRVAVVSDAQGAPLGLSSRGPELPDGGQPPALHRWLWMEYVARDAAAALTFYGEAVGFRHELFETRNAFTYYLLSTDRPRAGLFLSPWPRATSAWLPYVRVADAAAAAARAVELGGSVLLAPRADVRNGSLAIVLDPAGAPVALQKFPFANGATP
jgi:predicted enzyme related to lactoylglutathione lyase